MVETGSTGDTVIFEEFKGTGNAELKLDRKIAERRVFPAVDVNPSGTRKDELLLSPDEAAVLHKLRRVLSGLDSHQAIDLLIDRLQEEQEQHRVPHAGLEDGSGRDRRLIATEVEARNQSVAGPAFSAQNTEEQSADHRVDHTASQMRIGIANRIWHTERPKSGSGSRRRTAKATRRPLKGTP